MPPAVTALAVAPVKGLRVADVETIQIGPAGVEGDRAFLVLDEEHRLLLTTRTPRLLQVAARLGPDGTLTLTFPDGREVAERPEPGEPAVTAAYDGREIRGRLVRGALAEALSEHMGRPLVLLARDPAQR